VEVKIMDIFWTIVTILFVLWIFGIISGIGGGIIHILLIIAAIVIVYRLVQGRNMLTGR
jgi:hypothetical protein